jgi:hypothetical protein
MPYAYAQRFMQMPGGNDFAWRQLKEQGKMGWKELVILELTTIPTILEEHSDQWAIASESTKPISTPFPTNRLA